MIIKKCPWCGAEFKASTSKTHCSVMCRLWDRIDIQGPNDCWVYLGGRDKEGYGWITHQDRNIATHQLVLGAVGTFVCHTCDNPPCCNPAHLYVGDPKSNTRDAMERHGFHIGEKNGNAKITDDIARAILDDPRTGYGSGVAIARDYGVNPMTVTAIRTRRQWRHLS